MSKPTIIIVLVILAGIGFASFRSTETITKVEQPKPTEIKWEDDLKNPVNICIAKGGIPITSAWDGRLKDCKL